MGQKATKCIVANPRSKSAPTEGNLALWFNEDCVGPPLIYKDLTPIRTYNGCMLYSVKVGKGAFPSDMMDVIYSFNIRERRWYSLRRNQATRP